MGKDQHAFKPYCKGRSLQFFHKGSDSMFSEITVCFVHIAVPQEPSLTGFNPFREWKNDSGNPVEDNG